MCGLHGIRVVLREFLILIIHLQCSYCIYSVGTFFFMCHAPYKSGFILGPKIQGGPNCLSAGVGGLVGPSKYSGSMIMSSHLLLKELTLLDPPAISSRSNRHFCCPPPQHSYAHLSTATRDSFIRFACLFHRLQDEHKSPTEQCIVMIYLKC